MSSNQKGVAASARRVSNARKRLKGLQQFGTPPAIREAQRAALIRDLQALQGPLRVSAAGSKKYRALLEDVRAMLGALDDRPGAQDRQKKIMEQRASADRRRALSGLWPPGPKSLPYERLDPGKKLDKNGHVRTDEGSDRARPVSVRTIGGGLPGLGRHS